MRQLNGWRRLVGSEMRRVAAGAFAVVLSAALAVVLTLAAPPRARGEEPTPAATGQGEDGVSSAEAYFAGLAKAGESAGERKKFADKYEGRKVSWTGYVRAVSRNKSPDGDTFLLIVKTALAAESPQRGFLAWFGTADEEALTALQENQKVTVSGTLSVQRDPAIPDVKEAKIE